MRDIPELYKAVATDSAPTPKPAMDRLFRNVSIYETSMEVSTNPAKRYAAFFAPTCSPVPRKKNMQAKVILFRLPSFSDVQPFWMAKYPKINYCRSP